MIFKKNKDGVIVGNNSVWELVASREKVKVKNGQYHPVIIVKKTTKNGYKAITELSKAEK
ncbi:hypothetical protein NLX69_10710 [Rossellomorea sp. BNER]|nr:hypothetical protein [Rossellomorea sp. BNER]